MKKNNIYNIIIGSYFDPLGHPIFADKIIENILKLSPSSDYKIYALSPSKQTTLSHSNIIPIHVKFFGKFYSYSYKKLLTDKFGLFGLAMFFSLRLYVITIFYFKTYKKIKENEINIDLEYEPVQDFIVSLFRSHQGKRINIIHSFDYEEKINLKMIYKKLSLKLIRNFLKKSNINKIGLMNNRAYNSALSIGIPENQLILAGWGFDDLQIVNNDLNVADKPHKDKKIIKILSFGLIRRSKMLNKISNLFYKLDNPDYQLNIIGKSIDNEVDLLIQTAQQKNTRTLINIEDRYVDEKDVSKLISDNDIMLISHEEGFTSISGPLLLAFEHCKPVLCFSKNTVKDLVNETNAGIVLDLETTSPNQLKEAINSIKDHTYSQDTISKFRWKEITKRLIFN